MRKILILLLSFLSLNSYSEEIKIIQAGKSFLADTADSKLNFAKNSRGKYKKSKIKKMKIKAIDISVGDTLIFLNKDNVSHNVFGKGFNFNQPQGSIDKKTFDKKGTRIIRCAIHPKMKLKVNVK